MNRKIDTTVKIDPNDTTVHIGVTCFPMAIDTTRFTPLTETGRKILRMGYNEYRLSMSRERSYELYDQLGASGYAVCEEVLESLDDASKWDLSDDAYLAFLLDSTDHSGCDD